MEEEPKPHFYALERGWPFDQGNAATRFMHLGQEYTSIERHFEELREFSKDPTPQNSRKAGDAITNLMHEVEAFLSVYPSLEQEDWFRDLRDHLAKAFWREEERLISNHPDKLLRFVQWILQYADGPPGKSFLSLLYVFIRDQGKFLVVKVQDELQPDMDEARDLVSVGHPATALLVLGRAVEKALHRIGLAVGVATVSGPNWRKTWEETSFGNRARALRFGSSGGRPVSLLSKAEYLEIAMLVHHRNTLAHKDYDKVSKVDAERMLRNALALLLRLDRILSEDLPRLPSGQVDLAEADDARG